MRPVIKYSTAQEALSVIKSGDRVFLHGSAQTPVYMISELAKEAGRLKNVELVSVILKYASLNMRDHSG
jgi:DeoR/GlpR family transcriptional regulator of sugar metabolism